MKINVYLRIKKNQKNDLNNIKRNANIYKIILNFWDLMKYFILQMKMLKNILNLINQILKLKLNMILNRETF